MAGAVFSLLALVTSLLVLAGVLITPVLIGVIAPGFEGEKREITIRLVRILFPGPGCWCSRPGAWACSTATGVSSSPTPRRCSGTRDHRHPDRVRGAPGGYRLAEMAAWGSVAGSALQFGVQLPAGAPAARGLAPGLDRGSEASAR